MGRRKHQERALAIIATLEGDDAVDPEVAIPQASRAIDAVMVLGEASEGWGPLRPLLCHRKVIVEHFSRSPSLASCVRSVAKLAWLVDEWWTAAPPADARAPLLLLLSCGTPRTALDALAELRPLATPGIWCSHRPALGDLVLVDIRRLPADLPGTSVLRLMATPRTRRQADAHIAALQTDPALVQSLKDRLVEALMDRTIPSTEQEQRSIVERLRQEGRQEGRREGRQEGRQEGRRELLLALLAKRLGAATATELAETETEDQLEQRLMTWLAGE